MKQSQELFKFLFADSNKGKYSFDDRKEGMMMGWQDNSHRIFLINKDTEEAWEMVDANGKLCWDSSVVNDESLHSLPYDAQMKAINMRQEHLEIMNYRNGVTCATWRLQTEFHCGPDEDGFGMEDDEEINLYAVMDKYCNILVPFQPMDEKLQKRFFRNGRRHRQKRRTHL